MTSLLNNYKQTTAMYINVASVYNQIYDSNGAVAQWASPSAGTLSNALTTAGATVFRDMGKTIYLPASSTASSQSTILRKVQLVPAGGLGYYGTGGNVNNEFYTGYIRIGGQSYGGGDGVPTPVARIG
ncbi:MAG: hypothetical protein EBT07_04890 [Actinobacteria bacterium]|nr:hypothetical protein [Actinomycetota bacterium]